MTGPEQMLLPVATGTQVRRYLQELMRGRWPLALVTVVAMAIASLIGLVGPIAIGQITQAIADHRPLDALVPPIVLLLGAAVTAAVAGWIATVLLFRLVMPAVAQLREDAVDAAVELPIDAVEAGGSGDLVSRVSGDVEIISEAASGALGAFIGSALTILFTLVGLAALDWRFALAGLLAVPIQAHTLRWYLRASRPIYAGGRIAVGRRTSALLTGFTALPTLRALRLGGRQRDRIAAASAKSMEYEFRAIRAATRFFARLNLAEFIGLGGILLVAFLLVRFDLATIGQATTAALFFAGLFDPINTVLWVFDDIQQAAAGLARLVGITTVDAAPGRRRPGSATAPRTQTAPATLKATDIRFGYHAGPDVLHAVALHVDPGQHIAIVGATGSGKSTLASVLSGLRQPRAGTMRFGNVELAVLEQPQRQIALVTQETHVFTGSLADNLRLAAPAASDAELREALAAVGALSWVAALEDDLETSVGGGGLVLTASQAQQVALARVLLLDPPLVILDEATAEAGSNAARTLDQAAAAVLRARSSVTIAHRLNQAAAADLIVVMAAGQVIEQGSQEELLASGGAYAELWRAWSGTQHVAEAPRE